MGVGFGVFAGIRDLISVLHASPLLHLVFRWHPRFGVSTSRVAPVRGSTYFSLPRQRKVGKRKPLNTASTCSCLRAPNRSYTSHGVALLTARCQRSEGAPHPLHTPASQHVLQDSPPPPRWQTVCRLSRLKCFT